MCVCVCVCEREREREREKEERERDPHPISVFTDHHSLLHKNKNYNGIIRFHLNNMDLGDGGGHKALRKFLPLNF